MRHTRVPVHHLSLGVVVVVVATFLFFFSAQPERAVSQSTPTVIFLTSTAATTWTVPNDWVSSNNTIEVIGGGAGATYRGAGGGAYSRVTNVTLTPGATVGIRVGSGGVGSISSPSAGGDTYLCNSTSNCSAITGSAVVVGAKGGAYGVFDTDGGLGGAASAGVGTVKYSGGNGGNKSGLGNGTGGGAAAGPSGDGRNAGSSSAGSTGGGTGGGGAGGGSSTAGSPSSSSAGTLGGQGRLGSGAGTAGLACTSTNQTACSGGAGSNGGGGGGGGGSQNGGHGGAGGSGTDWSTAGAGGGGGGGGNSSGNVDAGNGASGGLYGGGGGGVGSYGNFGAATPGNGAQGIIVITYYPQTVPTAPTALNATADSDSIALTWVTPSSNGGSPITGYKIYRGTSSNPTTLLTSVGVVNTFDDTTATPNTTYYYRAVATNALGDSPYSNEDSALIALPQCVAIPGSTAITGYAWSDTIGWIDFNCTNSGTCGTSNFGVAIANDGTLSGCAWSEHVGWVSASEDDLGGCPSGTCSARMDELALEGWMKVLSANDAQSGGWDGFISLSGSSPTYGPILASSTLSGYAWGDTNLGWVSFNAGSSYDPVQTTWLPSCASNYVCTDSTHRQSSCTNAPIEACSTGLICSTGACVLPPAPFTPFGGELRVFPSFIGYNNTVTVSWNVESADSCTVTEDNPTINDSWSTLAGSETSSPLTRVTTYTLFCTGLGGDLTQTATVSRRPDWREI